MATYSTPNLLTDPGTLYYAPVGTAIPTFTVAGSKFTQTWSSPWVPLGCTEEGSEFSASTDVEAIEVAELFYPVAYVTTKKEAKIAFALTDFTLNNIKRVMNGGTLSTVSGTGATTLSKYVPPTPGNEVRCMVGWQSLDDTVVMIGYQLINATEIQMSFKKAPAKATLPVEFQFEKPSATEPFEFYTAGTVRVGT
jgi:hypothetical protein